MRWPEVSTMLPSGPSERTAARSRRETGPLLSVENLTISYNRTRTHPFLFRRHTLPITRNVSLDLRAGEITALVGESGSGKSTIARAISGRLPPQSGTMRLNGKTLKPALSDRSQQELRDIQYIFQNPDASLNPRRSVRAILERPLKHFGIELAPNVLESALENVRLHAGYLGRYPEQLSGGERQRIAIARALLAAPKLLICDEILSSLDVSVQATVVDLLLSLREQQSVAMLFISHDLAVVRHLADRVAVLYRGELMQMGDADTLFNGPHHPYTEMLLRSAPNLRKDQYVPPQPAMPSSRTISGEGCALSGRCPRQIGTVCAEISPPLRPTSSGFIRCHIPTADL
jgi:peptide/nickel transport system ATP-binding protein